MTFLSYLRPLCWLAVLALTSCGAGIISGVVAGSDNGSSPPVVPLEPSVTLPVAEGPLYIAPGESYEATAVLANIDVPTGFEVVVEFVLPADGAAPELVERQSNVVISGVSTIRWQIETEQIRARFADLTAQDVEVEVRIGVQRESVVEVLGTSRYTLLRRRVVAFDPSSDRTVSVIGGPVTVRVKPTVGADVVVEVRTASGRTLPAAVRGRHTDGDESVLSLDLPAGETPEELSITVVDAVAGRSTEVGGAFYGPELFAVVDRSGRTTGDETISLIGAGLIPVVFDPGSGESTLEFDRVEVVFERGGQETVVDSTQFVQSSSTPNALTLRSPASPDGREGNATVVVRVTVDDSSGGHTVVSDREDDVFAYAASNPQFEPRGLALGIRPEGIDLGQLTGTGQVSDVAALYLNTIDFTGFVRVFEGVGNGMLRTHGVAVPTSEPGIAQLLLPVDVAVGDFAGDSLDDVMVANLGFGAVPLTSLLENDLGRPGLLAGFEPGLVVVEQLVREAHRVSLVAPGQDDFLVVARQGAAYATRPGLLPRWVRDVWPDVFNAGTYTIVSPIDHDEDGLDEVVMVIRTEPSPRWRVSILRGIETDPDATMGPFDVTDRFADYEPRFVLDASAGDGEMQLAFVLEPLNGDTDPWRVDVLEPVGSNLSPVHSFALPDGFDVGAAVNIPIGSDHGFGILFGSALEGGLALYRRAMAGGYELLGQYDRLDYERVGAVLDMSIGELDGGQKAVFLLHEPPFQTGGQEVRVSTLLIDPVGKLLGPRALRELPDAPIDVTAVGPDLGTIVVSHPSSLSWFESDDFGGLSLAGNQPLSSSPVPGALLKVTLDDGDHVAFLDADGFVWLGSSSALPQRAADALDFSEIGAGPILSVLDSAVGDVDGDGRDDLVFLVRIGTVGSETFECIVPLLGVNAQFPFSLPSASKIFEVSGAASLAIGNFASDGTEAPRNEIAVAVPSQGIRFLRWEAGRLNYREQRTASTNAFALDGRAPSIVRAIDFDADGVDGLAVLSSARGQALFYAQKTPMVGVVPADGFELIDARVVTPGEAEDMRVTDVDGDLIPDFVVYIRDLLRRPSVAVMLWDGTDRVHSLFSLDWRRIGTTPPAVRDVHGASLVDRRFAWTLADTNHDGVSDLVLTFERGTNTYELDANGDIIPVERTRENSIHTLFGSRR
ncbi:MAG: hypothetical protein KDB80_05855 [Planctomycetes bacterium]|nr:hypothetical protein [Planctomycetota bacterium]